MTRRERLLRTLRGEEVDRPPVSFYEINGLDEHPEDDDPFNIYAHPSWRPLIELARDHTDRIVMRGAAFEGVQPDPVAALAATETRLYQGSLYTEHRLTAGNRTLTAHMRRDPDVNTIWTEEHLLKAEEDLQAFLTLSPPVSVGTPDLSDVLAAEAALGDSGIVMLDTPDPLCLAASLFDLGTYTTVALTQPGLFRALLDWFAPALIERVEAVARELPGRLWRIYGPEYAAPPYLPPTLFREFVVPYVAPMIAAIQRHGGYARIHSHGRLRDILDDIAAMRPDGLDPIEPPPQGDVALGQVRADYGRDMVLFGNLEASDIETLPSELFRDKVQRALDEGTRTPGRGFVLMPSACPYGRILSMTALHNYETIIECVEAL